MLYSDLKHICTGVRRFASFCIMSSVLFTALYVSVPSIEDINTITNGTGVIDDYASNYGISTRIESEEYDPDSTPPDEEEYYAPIVSAEDEKEDESDENDSEKYIEPVPEAKVRAIKFKDKKSITMHQDDMPLKGQLKVDVLNKEYFAPSNIVLVSEKPEVVEIKFDYSLGLDEIHYRLVAYSCGETIIYAQTEDGKIESEKIKVVVKKNEVESIKLSNKSIKLQKGESKDLKYALTPEKPRNDKITWDSSDHSVATVSDSGVVTAENAGKATITAMSSNGVKATCTVTVHISKNDMYFLYSLDRLDSNKIGREWEFYITVNGKDVNSIGYDEPVTLKVGDNDKKPDVGKKTVKHTVTEKDLIKGFTVKVHVYVTENGGRYKGKKAHFVNEFKYSVNEF